MNGIRGALCVPAGETRTGAAASSARPATSASRSAASSPRTSRTGTGRCACRSRRAIFLDDPHDGGLDRLRRAGGGRLAGGHPVDGEARVPLGRRRRHRRAEQGATASCNAIFPKLAHIPKRNKDLVLTHTDKHGEPDAVLQARRVRRDEGHGRRLRLELLLEGLGRAARAAPTTGPTAATRSATPRQHRSNGRWSDGVPIAPLKIQDAAPIRP